MKRKEVENLVTNLTMLIKALPNCSTIEPLEQKARESAGVYETSYNRNSVDGEVVEYLDVFFDEDSQVMVTNKPDVTIIDVIPSSYQHYAGSDIMYFKKETDVDE